VPFNPALSKQASFFESQRRPISQVFAVTLLAIAFFTVPQGLGTGWHEVAEWLGFLLLIVAALGRVWALAHIAGRKNRELCQSGPYELTRNPLYFFSFLGVIGFALAVQNILLGSVAAAGFLAYYAGVIRGEERRLRILHPEAFPAYCVSTPRFWPRLEVPATTSNAPIDMGAFTRGLGEVFWFLSAIILADMLEWVHLQHFLNPFTLPF